LYSAVRYLSQDPYYLYNGPNATPPKSWHRIKTFIYGCAIYAEEQEVTKLKAQMGGGVKKAMGM
jgi:hypothetical protein